MPNRTEAIRHTAEALVDLQLEREGAIVIGEEEVVEMFERAFGSDPDVEAMARELWEWNCEMGGGSPYPYERLIEPTKEDLRTLAQRLARHI